MGSAALNEETDDLGRPIGESETPVRAPDEKATRLLVEDGIDTAIIRAIMETSDGRNFIFRFLSACKIYGEVADLGSDTRQCDPLLTYFRCGEVNVGKILLSKVQTVAPKEYMTMIKENKPNG